VSTSPQINARVASNWPARQCRASDKHVSACTCGGLAFGSPSSFTDSLRPRIASPKPLRRNKIYAAAKHLQ
jgi:hypothetical protein